MALEQATTCTTYALPAVLIVLEDYYNIRHTYT